MEDLSQLYTEQSSNSERSSKPGFPMEAHAAIICGQTGCGKTEFILDLLQTTYRNVFEHIVILCPNLKYNKAYQSRVWVRKDREVYTINPTEQRSIERSSGSKLDEWLEGINIGKKGSNSYVIFAIVVITGVMLFFGVNVQFEEDLQKINF